RYASAATLIEALDAATRPRRWRRWAVTSILLTAVLALGLFYSLTPRPDSQTPVAGAVAAPVLERLELYLRPQDAAPERRLLVSCGAEQALGPPIPPLGPKDCFKLHGQFRQPTHWYLLWLDTAGAVEVSACAEQPQTALEYPVRECVDKECWATVDENNPPGVHLLLVVTGGIPPGQGCQQLLDSLRRVGKP